MKDEEWLLEEKYGGKKTEEFEADRCRLARGEPVAYVIGWQPFLGLKIFLDSRPLIPRPETEWWTEQLLSSVCVAQANPPEERTERDGASKSNFSAEKYAIPKAGSPVRPPTFLDLCAGSGAIGCAALARLPDAQVYFGERDPAHETTIRKNIRENGLDALRADIRIGDLFAPFSEGMRFDVIAANPPYIPEGRMLPESVAAWEPESALRAGSDGLSLIRRIADELPTRLERSGAAWVECDSSSIVAARELFLKRGFIVEIRTDQYGAPRVLVCRHTRARSAH